MKKISIFMAIAAAASLASCTAQCLILSVWLRLKV